MEAKIDVRELGRSIKSWSRQFGDTNEEALVRITTFLARDLARKTQPWGVGRKQRDILEGAVAKDVRKSLRTVDDSYFAQLQQGTKRSVRFRGDWLRVRKDQLLTTPAAIIDHVNSLRSSQSGKVDKRRVTKNSVRVTSESLAAAAIKEKSRLAGMTKGLWLVAGRKAAKLVKKKGLNVKTRGWPGSVGERKKHLADASLVRDMFKPYIRIVNMSPMTRMERFMKVKDIKGSTYRAYRATIRQYKRAVERINASKK